jgi:hypothetical protein
MTIFRTAFAASLICLSAPALSQATSPGPSAAAAPPAAARPAVLDADAAAALDRMGAFLRTLRTFEVTSNSTTETVYANGQKLQFLQRANYIIGGPEQMVVEIRTDRQNRRVYYDGQVLTLSAPNAKLYTQFGVTGGISDVLGRAYEDWGIEFPLQDLFRWGDSSSTAVIPSEGFKVGAAQIGEYKTDHFAFRQPGVDFQIWIEQGDKPLPRKLVITNTEDEAQPQFVAYFMWDLKPKIAPGTFAFKPGKDDKRIDLSAGAAAAGK